MGGLVVGEVISIVLSFSAMNNEFPAQELLYQRVTLLLVGKTGDDTSGTFSFRAAVNPLYIQRVVLPDSCISRRPENL